MTTSLAAAWRRMHRFGDRHRASITIVGAIAAAAVLVAILWGKRDEFSTALSSASITVLLGAAALQLVALLARSEAWHICIEAAGGTVARRVLYRASSMGYVGSLLNAQVGTAARIAALRRSSPDESPGVSTLIAAEFPILAVEATLAALTSFTLVVPLGLPWWLPIVCLAVILGLSAGLDFESVIFVKEEAPDLFRDFLGHPSCLYVTDPEFRAIDLICDLVRKAGDRAALVGLDSLAERARVHTREL